MPSARLRFAETCQKSYAGCRFFSGRPKWAASSLIITPTHAQSSCLSAPKPHDTCHLENRGFAALGGGGGQALTTGGGQQTLTTPSYGSAEYELCAEPPKQAMDVKSEHESRDDQMSFVSSRGTKLPYRTRGGWAGRSAGGFSDPGPAVALRGVLAEVGAVVDGGARLAWSAGFCAPSGVARFRRQSRTGGGDTGPMASP